uniref:Nipped-B protein n=1 Tax=Schistocephalus solidus TaxID=70667 RepID=A0A0V0J446_SCHSO
MLGDIGRIPIITLSACKSLSEILSELPLPQPTPNVPPDTAKLLNDPIVEESAQTNLQSCKEWLVDILATALDSTSTDSITLKNNSKAPPIDFHTLPPLLKDTISKRPSLLEKNKSFQCIYSNKEVLKILSGGASKTGSSCGRLTSPYASSGCTRNDASAVGATKTRSQKQTSQPGLYSVVSVEPLKLSIKRAANHSQQPTSDAGQAKQRRRRRAPGKDSKAPKRTSAVAATASVATDSHLTAVPVVTPLPTSVSESVTYAPSSSLKDSTWADGSGSQNAPLSIPVARLPSAVPAPLDGTSVTLAASVASHLSIHDDSRPTQPTPTFRLSHEKPFAPNESLLSQSVAAAAPSVSTVTVSLRVPPVPTSESAPHLPLTSPMAALEPVVTLSSTAISTTVHSTNLISGVIPTSTTNPVPTQLFQSATLFDPHQMDVPASCESSENVVAQNRWMLKHEGGAHPPPQDSIDAIGGAGGGGGSHINSLRNNVVSGASSISSVPPSNVSAEGHAMLQSGLLFDDPFSVPRSPSSVPSNCSYPATPAMSAMAVAATASVVPTAISISASPFQSHSCSSAISGVGVTAAGSSAPSINLFGVNVTPLQGDDGQSNSAPRGLAAYLKKSKCHTKLQSETLANAATANSVSTAATLSSPSSFSNPNHGSNTTLSPARLPAELEEDAYTHQHGSAPPLQVSSPWSTDGRGSNPVVHPDHHHQHSRRRLDKEGSCAPVTVGAYSSSLSNTPVNERETRPPGKRRGRRRRSEIEELMNWRVRDPKKRNPQGSSPPRPSAGETDLPPADSAASSLTPVPEEEIGVSAKPPPALSSMVVVVSSDNETYAEAMVERVKRRRQQRGKVVTSSSSLLRSDDGDLSTNEDTKIPPSSYPASSASNRITQMATIRRNDIKLKQSNVKNYGRVLRSSDESEPELPPPAPPPPPAQTAEVVTVDSANSDSSDLSTSPPRKRGVSNTKRLLKSEPSPQRSLTQQQNSSALAACQNVKTEVRIKVEETSSSELDSGSEAHKPPRRYATPLSASTGGGGLMGSKSGLATTASFILKQENDAFDATLSSSSSSLSDGTPSNRQPLNRLGVSSPEKLPKNTPVPPELEQMHPSRPSSSSCKPPKQPRSPDGPPPLLPLPQSANQAELSPSKRRGSKHYPSSCRDSSSSVSSEREPPFTKDFSGRKQQTTRHSRRKPSTEMPSASPRQALRTPKCRHRAHIAEESHSNDSTSSSSSSSSSSSLLSDEAREADERIRNSRMAEDSQKRKKLLKKSAFYRRMDTRKMQRPSSRRADSASNASGHFSSSATGSAALSSSPLSSDREDNDVTVKTIAGANCGGATPSTQPCTSSSALEDEDAPSLRPLQPCPLAPPDSPVSVASSRLSVVRDFVQTEEAELEKQRCSEELTNSAAALTRFTAHISDILRRIEELDLLKIASAIRVTAAAPSAAAVADASDEGEEGKEGGFSGDVRSATVDRTPVEARLSRREINALYHESGQVRVAGSMSTVPTGHLVRLLTLLLVNIRDAAALPAPNPTPSDFRELLRRRKARLQRHHHHRQGDVTDKEQISESLLWSHPIWLRVLRGLDSALIALNIIAGPDVPRPLMMEDLIESVCAIVQFHFSRLIDWSNDLNNSKRATTSGSGELAASLSNLAKEAVGSRVGEALSALSSLVRLGGRFTDSLVLRLTELSLLLSGALLTSPVRRGTCPASGLLPKPAPSFSVSEDGDLMEADGDSDDGEEEVCRRLSARAKILHADQLEYYASNQWCLQLQRSTLGLIAAIYSRYDAHRKLIANDILALLNPRKPANGVGGGNTSAAPTNRTPVRTFWILASGSFLKGWQPFQLIPTPPPPSEGTAPTMQSTAIGSTSSASCQLVVNKHYLLVHSFSALLLAVVQSLIPAPSHLIGGSSSRRCSSAGAPATPSSGVSQQSTTAGTVFSAGTSGDGHTADAIQVAKEEKALLTAYTAAFHAAHYLLTGLFKRASFKGEEDLKPILETVLMDFLRVAADAPLEWPAANLLLNVFGTLFIQQLSLTSSRGQSNHHHSSASSRASETGTRLLAAEQLITLAGGLRRLSALRRAGGYPTHTAAAVSSPEAIESRAGVDLSLTEAKLCVSSFLNSSVLSMYHLTLACDDTSLLFSTVHRRWMDRSAVRLQEYIVQRDFAYQLFYKLRFQHFDGLALTSRRFHQATWIQEASQQLSNGAAGANSCDQPQQPPPVPEENAVRSLPKERRRVEEFRLQMLSEFVATHPSVSGVAPWLPSRRSAAAAGHHCHRSGRFASPAHTDQLAAEQSTSFGGGAGSAAAVDPTAVSAFSPYTGHGLGVEARRRRTAAAHLLALKIFAHIDNSPGFDILFANIVKLLYDQSVQLRARALKGLSILVDIAPDCIQSLHPKSSQGRQMDPLTSNQGLLPSELARVIPARLLDSSPAVREAAVELVGRLVATNPDLFMPIYYAPLEARVLDMCVSVRKRAVRSLQTLIYDSVSPSSSNLCLSNKQLVEICVVLLRRLLHDEDSVKKLVLDTFQTLWFTPLGTDTDGKLSAKDKQVLGERISWLCEVMSNFRSRGFHVMEDFMNTLLTMETTEKPSPVDKACEQIVDHLASVVQAVLDPGSREDCRGNVWTETNAPTSLLEVCFSSTARATCPRHSKRRSATADGASSSRCTCKKQTQQQQQQRDGKWTPGDRQISVSSALAVLHLIAKCRASLVLQHAPMLVHLLSKVATSTYSSTSSSSSASALTTTNLSSSAASVDGVGHLESVALFHTTGAIEACCLHVATVKHQADSKLSFLFPDGVADFEKSLIILLQRQYRLVVDSALACLSTIVNRLTKDYTHVTYCFAQFYELLINERRRSLNRAAKVMRSDPSSAACAKVAGGSFAVAAAASGATGFSGILPPQLRPSILRALYTVGLICKHFSLEDLATTAFNLTNDPSAPRRSSVNLGVLTQQPRPEVTFGTSLRDEVFDTLMFFAEGALRLGANADSTADAAQRPTGAVAATNSTKSQSSVTVDDVELGKKAIAGVSFLANRHDHLFCSNRLQTFFASILAGVPSVEVAAIADLQCIILDCLTNFLMDEEKQMITNDSDCN